MTFSCFHIRPAFLTRVCLALLTTLTASTNAQTPQRAGQKSAQSVSKSLRLSGSGQQQTVAKLALIVHVPSGKLSIGELLASLSQQTSVSMRAEDGLQSRVIVAQFQNLSAGQILDALADIHDWRWFQTEHGSVWVARKRVVMPRSVYELPTALRTAIPQDFRRYAGMIPLMPESRLPAVRENPPFSLLATPLTNTSEKSRSKDLFGTAYPKILTAQVEQQKAFVVYALTTFTPGKPLFFTQMKLAQQNALTKVIVLQSFSQLDPNSYQMFSGYAHPALFDIPLLNIKLIGNNTLEISKTTLETVQGHVVEHSYGGAAVIDIKTPSGMSSP